MDTQERSIAKTITFRIIATVVTVIIVLFFTESLALASSIGALDLVSKLFIYYVHERVWNNFSWGKHKRKH